MPRVQIGDAKSRLDRKNENNRHEYRDAERRSIGEPRQQSGVKTGQT
jgi:hypothetical protein